MDAAQLPVLGQPSAVTPHQIRLRRCHQWLPPPHHWFFDLPGYRWVTCTQSLYVDALDVPPLTLSSLFGRLCSLCSNPTPHRCHRGEENRFQLRRPGGQKGKLKHVTLPPTPRSRDSCRSASGISPQRTLTLRPSSQSASWEERTTNGPRESEHDTMGSTQLPAGDGVPDPSRDPPPRPSQLNSWFHPPVTWSHSLLSSPPPLPVSRCPPVWEWSSVRF